MHVFVGSSACGFIESIQISCLGNITNIKGIYRGAHMLCVAWNDASCKATRLKDSYTTERFPLYVCMFVCMSACMYVCTYVCTYVCMYLYACMYACLPVCMYESVLSCFCSRRYVILEAHAQTIVRPIGTAAVRSVAPTPRHVCASINFHMGCKQCAL